MRVEELMIGDKVTAKRIECVGDGGQYQEWNEFGEIIRILEDTVYVMFDKQKDDWEEIDIKDIEPIPLTVEILEKNGLCKDNHGRLNGEYFDEDENRDLEITVDDKTGEIWWSYNWDEYRIIRLRYVHELQHALKLCEIQKEIVL